MPPELRDEIYKFCLVDPSGSIGLTSKFSRKRRVAVRCPKFSRCETPGDCWQARHNYIGNICACCQRGEIPLTPLVPNLLAACKQIHAEATDLLYGQPLAAQDTVALTAFLGPLSGPTRARLRDVTIAGWASGRSMQLGHNFAALTLLADCVRLRRLHINCAPRGWGSSVTSSAEGLYRDGHVFFEAWARANGARERDAVLRAGVLELGEVCYEQSWRSSRSWGSGRDLTRAEWDEAFHGVLSKCLMGGKKR